VVGAELLGLGELVVARRGDDRLHAHGVRELQAEHRDAAGALQQHGLAGDHLAVLHHGVPHGDAGAGQGRALLQ
jgi:hypothetical protein